MVKSPEISDFHSWFELGYACLLEAARDVLSFRSQPFTIRYRTRRGAKIHCPDFFVERKSGPQVVEVMTEKTKQAGGDPSSGAVAEYCEAHNYELVFVANEDIGPRRVQILNWLRLTRAIVAGDAYDTSAIEANIYDRLIQVGPLTIGQVVRHFTAIPNFEALLGIYRMLHRHQVETDLKSQPLSLDSRIYSS